MALVEYYFLTGGSNLNSGSTNATTAAITSTNGDWGNAAANRFTPAGGGTPFAAVAVGDWGSIFLDAASATPYIAQVTANNGSGATLDFSTTAKFGTAPATGATGRTLKMGGAWQNLGMTAASTALNTGTTPVAMHINVGPGTYASTTTDRAFGLSGTAVLPIIWEGYNTTPGDCSAGTLAAYALAHPAFTATTARWNITGTHNTFRCLDISGAYTSSSQIRTAGGGTHTVFERCRLVATGANAASSAVELTDGCMCLDCYVSASTTATRALSANLGVALTTSSAIVSGCTVRGGANNCIGMPASSTGGLTVTNTLCLPGGGYGIELEAANACRHFLCRNVTVYNTPANKDAIRLSALPVTGEIAFCYLHTISPGSGTAYGIYNASGTNTDVVRVWRNTYYNIRTATTLGFGDYPQFHDIGTDAVDGLPNAATGDFSLAAASSGYRVGAGANFENESFRGWLSCGAVDPASGAAGSSIIHSASNQY